MAEDQTTVSAEAFKRVEHERDELKAQVAKATQALQDIALRDRLVEHYEAKKIPNPSAVASRALSEFREVPETEFAAKADSWYEAQRKLFFGDSEPVASAPASPPPASPWEKAPASPLPGGGRTVIPGNPIVAGTPEFLTWARGKSSEQLAAAVRSNEVVIPDSVKQAQRSIGPF